MRGTDHSHELGAELVRFRTAVELGGKTATGFEVPADVVERLGGGKRPPVRVRIGGHEYRSTIASRGGRFMVPLSAENRGAAEVAAGDEIDVEVELDSAPREVELPPEVAALFEREGELARRFAALSYSHRREWVGSIESAKRPETRQRRLEAMAAALRGSA